jgi:hypothetical protein
MSIYFWNGFWHLIAAILFTLLFDRLTRKNNLKNVHFLIGLIFTSSAIFFIPLHIPLPLVDKLYQFIHYPLPDWDILLLGMNWHRFFFTHSLLIPLIMMGYIKKSKYNLLISGISIGLSSHLIWDCITGSMMTAIVFIPGLEITGQMAKSWLAANGIALFVMACYKK